MYREIAPPPDLAAHVACVWTSVSSGGTILPDGCVDVVWRGDRLIVAGPATGPMPSDVPAGTTVFGVRFRLGAAGAALERPASELADANVALWSELDERVAEGGLEALLEAVRERVREPVDPLTRAAALAMARPGARVDALDLGLSERQLRRRFLDAVGYGPKTLARILRFQRFLALAGEAAGTRRLVADGDGSPPARSAGGALAAGEDGLAGLAFAAGYADQAHLTRECRRLAGRTPAELVAAGAGPAGERVRFVQAAGAPGAYRPAG